MQDLGYTVPLRADIGAPKNIGEDYRRNTPVLYYAFDENFLDFFGSNGVWAVDQAFAILNNLTNVSSLQRGPVGSPARSETLQSDRRGLEPDGPEIGGALPHSWSNWAWPTRSAIPGPCMTGSSGRTARWACSTWSTKRNFDIVPSALDQLQYSSYVNGVLFLTISTIIARIPSRPVTPLSEAVDIPVDVPINAARFAPVSSFTLREFVCRGRFYTGLTRDDVAGLRYLLRSDHVHWEDVPANSIVFVTNNAPTGLQLLVTSNLTLLAAQSLTNDDATLLGLYPGLAIVPGSTIPSFTNVVTTNVSAYYTNSPSIPSATPPHLVLRDQLHHQRDVRLHPLLRQRGDQHLLHQGYVTVIDTNLYFPPMGRSGTSTTNITTTTMLTNMVSGDYYIIPTTSCGVQILSNVLTTVVGITNTLIVTNTPTNAISGSYLLGRTYISWFTNHNLAFFQVLCVTNEPSLRRGIEKITFVKTAYDSLLGKFYNPQTNFFTMTTVTNSTNWVQTFQRVATAPDFLFTATDTLPGPAAALDWVDVARSINFNQANVAARTGRAGDHQIRPRRSPLTSPGPSSTTSSRTTNWFLDERTAAQYAYVGLL